MTVRPRWSDRLFLIVRVISPVASFTHALAFSQGPRRRADPRPQSPATTAIYTKVRPARLKEAVAGLSFESSPVTVR